MEPEEAPAGPAQPPLEEVRDSEKKTEEKKTETKATAKTEEQTKKDKKNEEQPQQVEAVNGERQDDRVPVAPPVGVVWNLEEMNGPKYDVDIDALGNLPLLQQLGIFTDEEKNNVSAEMARFGLKVPTSLEEVSSMRSEYMETFRTFRNGRAYTDSRPKLGVPKAIWYTLDWMGRYYRIRNTTLEENRVKVPRNIMQVPAGLSAHMEIPGMAEAYEQQGVNACFCCAGTVAEWPLPSSRS